MRRSIWTRGSVQFGLLLLLSAAVFGLRLGDGGLWATEGHRALPAFAMHESGDWLVPRLFEQPYLRKPPGIQWLMQAGIELFGDSPFAARAPVAVCATLMVLVAWRFGRLWFGPRGGLASGLAMLLMPWVWPAARAAEIETLNNLGTQLAAMALLHVAVSVAQTATGARAANGESP
ncbi:MAG: glycosyltransferase family 39 protein, partial [Planctomycetota bacterium]